MAFLGEIRLSGGRHGWGCPPKAELALVTSENKGEAQSPLVLRVNPQLPSIRVPGVCQCLDCGPGIAVPERPRCPARHPRGLWGVAPHCFRCPSPLGALERLYLGSCSCHGGAGLSGRCGARQEHYLILPNLLAFPVAFSSRVFQWGRAFLRRSGVRAGPGCLTVNDLNSKECSEQEQRGSRECSSAERGWEITPGSPGMSFVLGWL